MWVLLRRMVMWVLLHWRGTQCQSFHPLLPQFQDSWTRAASCWLGLHS